MNSTFKTVNIENIQPELDGGRYAIKREVGDTLDVTADVFKDGHDILAVFLLGRVKGQTEWTRVSMEHVVNDQWKGQLTLTTNGRYEYTVSARPDLYRSWLDEVGKKHKAGQDIKSELLEGYRLMNEAALRASPTQRVANRPLLKSFKEATKTEAALQIAHSSDMMEFMDTYPDLTLETRYDHILEVMVDRVAARFASWYEFFPRSQGKVPGQGSTFLECEERLPAVKAMGFDVVYLPPIHPIGMSNRKGKNNSLTAGPDEPGSPYAIGSAAGGHKAVEPALGTLEDFDHFVKACKGHGLEVALDFAINCSPDHPYVTEHPEWFYKRPDGTIKYAENPPKKYQDIYPVNFYCADWKKLWEEMKSIILFWVGHGVKIFRVDNPHTKPVSFWEWMIAEVQAAHPDVLFLAEAFTKPKMMRLLAKVGFSQSYTYFTWRNFKHEIMDYHSELTQGPMKEYFRGNLFATTPDILPVFLQEGGRPAFIIRATLAATLASVYGMYSGFELCENRALPGKEEFLDSEKYEIRAWDWDRPGHITPLITKLNHIRKANPALHEYHNLEFYQADNDRVLFYGKSTPDLANIILVVVNLDPFQKQHSFVHVPVERLGLKADETYQMHDLLTDKRFLWRGAKNYVEFNPHGTMVHVFRLRRWLKKENDFDYFSM